MLCNCCCVLSDQFNRADSSDIGGEWTVVSGSPAIASNALSLPDGCLLIWETDNPRGAEDLQSSSVKVSSLDYGAALRMIVGYVDDDNYIAAEYLRESGSGNRDGHLAIVSRVSGSETTEKWSYFPDDTAALYVCLRPEVGATPATLTVITINTLSGSGTQVKCWQREVSNTGGLRGGMATDGGAATVDDWSFGKAYDYSQRLYDLTGVTLRFGTFGTGNSLPCFDPDVSDCGTQHDSSILSANESIGGSNLPSAAASYRSVGTLTGFGTGRIDRRIHNRGLTNINIGSSWLGVVHTLIWNYKDTNNFHYAKFAPTFAPDPFEVTVSIGKVTGGTDTVLATGTDTGGLTPNTVNVCHSEGDAIATLSLPGGGSYTVSASGLTMHSGEAWYFGDGNGPSWVGRGASGDGSSYDDGCLECV